MAWLADHLPRLQGSGIVCRNGTRCAHGHGSKAPLTMPGMAVCQGCGRENPEGFRFCGFCTAPLDQTAAPITEERKVISVLFCDLVGFTASSDEVDPEDVRARLRPFHGRLRHEIERFGGTVEKFAGDAVMAVFGVPVAHEDDAERAVRAGLRILEAIDDLNERDAGLGFNVRIGINTGEAVVALGPLPDHGEGILADVVNTAARLQSAAPVGGVVVGEPTFLATSDVFDYQALAPVSVKGKAKPVALWRARAARARFGTDITRVHTAPLVGRKLEQTLLQGIYERAVRDASVQLVTIVGEPGIGKSRLVVELLDHLDTRSELVTWRQGRCLPYGDGITFWALGEIVKAQAGILESDTPERGRRQTRTRPCPPTSRTASGCGGACCPSSESSRLARRADEAFTAWRRFFESSRPNGPPCSSSRTCTGRTRRCSPSSSTLPTGRRGCRCWSSARPGRNCTSASPAGPGGSATRPRSTSLP